MLINEFVLMFRNNELYLGLKSKLSKFLKFLHRCQKTNIGNNNKTPARNIANIL